LNIKRQNGIRRQSHEYKEKHHVIKRHPEKIPAVVFIDLFVILFHQPGLPGYFDLPALNLLSVINMLPIFAINSITFDNSQ
jgi:hypothetical protein